MFSVLLYFTLIYFSLLYFTLLYFTLLYFTLLYFTLDLIDIYGEQNADHTDMNAQYGTGTDTYSEGAVQGSRLRTMSKGANSFTAIGDAYAASGGGSAGTSEDFLYDLKMQQAAAVEVREDIRRYDVIRHDIV